MNIVTVPLIHHSSYLNTIIIESHDNFHHQHHHHHHHHYHLSPFNISIAQLKLVRSFPSRAVERKKMIISITLMMMIYDDDNSDENDDV